MPPDTIPDQVRDLLRALGDEIQDVDEETFDLFAHFHASQDLGMLDARAEEVDVSIAGKDFTIKQSPGVLQSNRQTGTTGAVVWRTSIKFAEWLSVPTNILLDRGVIDTHSTVVELGTGISALVPLTLRGKVKRVVATDQPYALKLLQENVSANTPATEAANRRSKQQERSPRSADVEVLALDWESDDVATFLSLHKLQGHVDAVFVCDCIYNYALIQPLIDTCAEICQTREGFTREGSPARPALCVIAQQLRQPDVFEQWLRAFIQRFRVWRIPDDRLIKGLQGADGFTIHLGLLRSSRV